MEEINMIQCAQKCVNQKDGYCSLQGVGRLTNSINFDCPYYQEQSLDEYERNISKGNN